MSKNRPTFKTRSGKPIRAAGILLQHPELGYLMQEKLVSINVNGTKVKIAELSDFGGKTDATDIDVLDTMLREFKEETNGKIILEKKDLKNQKFKYFYESKYLLAIIKTNNSYQDEIIEMGNYENHDYIFRKVKWVNLKNNNKRIHNRLNKYLNKRKNN